MITLILDLFDCQFSLISINFFVLLLILLLILVIKIKNSKITTWGQKNKPKQIKIGTDGVEYTIVPNCMVVQTAYKFWVELQTRKLGLPIDLEHDVIVEVYNSWYTFFGVTRELIKKIPADELKDKNTQDLIKMALEVLNNHVRLHLTKWQAMFRKYYDAMIEDENNKDKSPQEIQKEFKKNEDYCYEKLSEDLMNVNKILIEYKNNLEKLIFDKPLT